MSLRRYLKDQRDLIPLIQRHQVSAPVDIASIARDLGIALWEDNLPSGISGMIVRDPKNGGKTGFSVKVDNKDPLVRKRFTAAHEIAHFLLHRPMIGAGIEDNALFRSRLSDKVEQEANQLAAEILMPVSLLQELLGSGVSDSGMIAKKLQVSETALKIRMGVPT